MGAASAAEQLIDAFWGPAVARFGIDRSAIVGTEGLPVLKPLSAVNGGGEARRMIAESPLIATVLDDDGAVGEALATVPERIARLASDLPAAGDYYLCQIAARGGPFHAATLLTSARACGARPNEDLLAAATGIELLVCFPMLLLEVVDDASSMERRLNDALAILLADFAVACSLRPLSTLPPEIVAGAAGLACSLSENTAVRADQLDGNDSVSERRIVLERIAAESFATAADFGARLAGADNSLRDALACVGGGIGMAVAPQGDLLDLGDTGAHAPPAADSARLIAVLNEFESVSPEGLLALASVR